MKARILKMLRESESYVSGQELCERLGVSRTAVWKVMNQLKEDGYQIEAVRNKGYQIVDRPDVMTKEELESLMDTAWAGRTVVCFAETDSTNIRAKNLAEQGVKHGTLAVADMQHTGKGRRGRGWISAAGTSIYMSLILRPAFPPSRAPMLTLLMAYSAAQAIREQEALEVMIKWPNDLVLNGKKICGILTEMSAEIDYINHVVIGIGVNTNEESYPEEIRETATSLRIEKGSKVKRADLIARIMKQFETNYERFLQTEDLSAIQDAYNRILVNCGRQVRVLEPGHAYDAVALGITKTGELQVEKEDGGREEIFAGEVSVRGIYGYV